MVKTGFYRFAAERIGCALFYHTEEFFAVGFRTCPSCRRSNVGNVCFPYDKFFTVVTLGSYIFPTFGISVGEVDDLSANAVKSRALCIRVYNFRTARIILVVNGICVIFFCKVAVNGIFEYALVALAHFVRGRRFGKMSAVVNV